jgi:hypothetical protein
MKRPYNIFDYPLEVVESMMVTATREVPQGKDKPPVYCEFSYGVDIVRIVGGTHAGMD